jgi:hypothetical protein
MFLTKRDATSFRSNACMPTNFIPPSRNFQVFGVF